MSTAIERHADRVRFVVATTDALYLDRLAHMGYLPIDRNHCATRWLEMAW